MMRLWAIPACRQTWTNVMATVTLDPDVQIMRFVKTGSVEFKFNKLALTYTGGNGDMNLDGKVEMRDFALFATYWQRTGCGTCGGADLTGNGNVSGDDLASFCDNWLAGI
jgi:hypothetical protein